MSRLRAVAAVIAAGCLSLAPVAAAGPGASAASGAPVERATATPIQHFVFLMQGDRTFDNYFGAYPGADGPPATACQPLVVTKPRNGCVRPTPLHGRTVSTLAPGPRVLDNQYDAGKMDGFVSAYVHQGRDGTTAMGYYDRRDLPYYWALADRYELFDRFFSSARYGNRTNRSYWVSAAPQPGGNGRPPKGGYGNQQTIFDRLQAAGVSWKFYVENYNPKQTFRTVSATDPAAQTVRVPLVNYARFVDDPALRSHIVDLSQYYRDLSSGSLPAVAYIASSGSSERSSRSMPAGQKLVQTLVTQLMLSHSWTSSAFLWSYDGSGGWYDHVKPPTVQGQVLGFRVPALLVSPYAPSGRINHTRLDYTSALRFIEDNWRLAPLTTRDRAATGLVGAFDFSAAPRAPELITLDPPPPGPRVKVSVAYWGYLGAAVIAVLLFLAAIGGGALLDRRARARAADPAAPDPGGTDPAPADPGGDPGRVPAERPRAGAGAAP